MMEHFVIFIGVLVGYHVFSSLSNYAATKYPSQEQSHKLLFVEVACFMAGMLAFWGVMITATLINSL